MVRLFDFEDLALELHDERSMQEKEVPLLTFSGRLTYRRISSHRFRKGTKIRFSLTFLFQINACLSLCIAAWFNAERATGSVVAFSMLFTIGVICFVSSLMSAFGVRSILKIVVTIVHSVGLLFATHAELRELGNPLLSRYRNPLGLPGYVIPCYVLIEFLRILWETTWLSSDQGGNG